MSVTSLTFQSFISPYLLSWPYLGHSPSLSSSRHSAIAPRKLSGVIGTTTLPLPPEEEAVEIDAAPPTPCWWW